MMDRVKKYCPELEWDDAVEEEFLENLAEARRIEITNERTGILRKLLPRNSRLIGVYPDEYIHSVYENLRGRDFLIRGSRQTYQPANYDGGLPILKTKLDAAFRKACSIALGRR